MDKKRNAFEEWYRNAWGGEPLNVRHFRKDEYGQYFSLHTHESWIVYQAAHESGYRAGFRAASGEVEQ